jgi:hypothetical protein
MDHLSSLVRRVRGSDSSSKRDRDAERDTRTRRHRDEPEIEEDEPLDVQPLQFEMPNEVMHETQPEAEAEDEVEGEGCHTLNVHCLFYYHIV